MAGRDMRWIVILLGYPNLWHAGVYADSDRRLCKSIKLVVLRSGINIYEELGTSLSRKSVK